jgi:arylsulfatase A-like enzyme
MRQSYRPLIAPLTFVFILADDLGINDLTAFGGGVAGGHSADTQH